MGMFSRRETPITGQVIILVPFELKGMVTFTLDERDKGPVVWFASFVPNLLTEVADSLEGNVQQLAFQGVETLKKYVPSATVGGLNVRIDESGDEPEVAIWGDVNFLASEWDQLKAQVSKGAMFAPRG